MKSFLHAVRQRFPQVAGIGAIMGAVLLLSLSDALVKLNSDTVALGQLLAVRSFTAVAILTIGATILTKGATARWPPNPWVWARSLCLTLMWICYYAALPVMSFPLAAACYYTSPIWMAALSAVLLGHRIGLSGMLAMALGLSGVLMILRPSMNDASVIMVLPLLAGFLYALAAVITAGRCREEPPLAMALNLNLVLAAMGTAYVSALLWMGMGNDEGFLFSAWPPLSGASWVLLLALGGLLAVIATAVAMAYQLAPAPVIGLFDNSYLVFASLWGLLLFAERPGMIDLAGMTMIGSGACLATGKAGASQQNRAPNRM